MELDNGMTAVFEAALDWKQIDSYEVIGAKGSIRVPKAFITQMYKGKAQIIVNKTDGAYREDQVWRRQYILEVEYFF